MRRQNARRVLLTAVGRLLPVVGRRPGAAEPRRVLVIRPDHLGDLIFTVPALRLLRSWLPGAHITALVGPWAADVLDRSPHVDEVQTFAFPWFDRQPKASLLAPYRRLIQEGTRLRSAEYDLALVLRFDHWWGALLAALAGIPQRVGMAIPECQPFLSQAVPYLPGKHEVEQDLRLVAAACGRPIPGGGPQAMPLEFPLSTDEEAAVEHILPERGSRPHIALHVGAGAPVKLWPAAHFVQVGSALQRRYGVRVVLTGSTAERGLVEQIAAGLGADCVQVVGAPLGEVAAVLRACRLVLGVDSGILHLAVAVGTPTVHLYGPVSPQTFGPWGDPERHRVVFSTLACAPCNRLDYSLEELPDHPCIRDIAVERVLGAAASVLQRSLPCA